MINYIAIILAVVSIYNIKNHWMFGLVAALCLLKLGFEIYHKIQRYRDPVPCIPSDTRVTVAITETIRTMMIIFVIIVGYIPMVDYNDVITRADRVIKAFDLGMSLDDIEESEELRYSRLSAIGITLGPNCFYNSLVSSEECLQLVLECYEVIVDYKESGEYTEDEIKSIADDITNRMKGYESLLNQSRVLITSICFAMIIYLICGAVQDLVVRRSRRRIWAEMQKDNKEVEVEE